MEKMRKGLVWLVIAAAMLAVAACGNNATPTSTPTNTPGAAATPTATLAPGQTATPAPSATPTATLKPVSFEGATIRLTVGYAPGGGFDTFARIFGVHLHEALPGKPQVIVANLPGADTRNALNFVLGAPQNDKRLDIAVFDNNLVIAAVLGTAPDVDPTEPIYLGKPDAAPNDQVLCVRTSVASSLDEFLALDNPSIGGTGGGANAYDNHTKWLKETGLTFRHVIGYGGTSELVAAFNRGEVDAGPMCSQAVWEQNMHWTTEDFATPLLAFDLTPQWVADGMAEGKYPWFGYGPDVLPGANPINTEALEVYHQIAAGSRMFAMSRNADPAAVAVLRQAFKDIVNSPAFIQDMTERTYTVGLLPGEEVQEVLESVKQVDPQVLEVLKRMYAPVQ